MTGYKDKNLLRELYVERRLSAVEIAERLGCAKRTVYRWLDEHGIDTRSPSEAAKLRKLREPPHFRTHKGYEQVVSAVDGEQNTALIHRLVAVSEHGFGGVSGKQVHHSNNIPWDNRPENLELVDIDEHARIHHESRDRDGRGRYV